MKYESAKLFVFQVLLSVVAIYASIFSYYIKMENCFTGKSFKWPNYTFAMCFSKWKNNRFDHILPMKISK